MALITAKSQSPARKAQPRTAPVAVEAVAAAQKAVVVGPLQKAALVQKAVAAGPVQRAVVAHPSVASSAQQPVAA